MQSKYAAIARLEKRLKAIEEDLCYTMYSPASEEREDAINDLFLQRREVIYELQKVH